MPDRGIYLSQDRSDIQYAVKELSRKMSKPNRADVEKLKHLDRYLIGRERAVIHFEYQGLTSQWTVWVDSDWAERKITRTSTSGGLVMFGSHVVRSWSTTQKQFIARSSGEAEYYSMVKGASMCMGVKALGSDMNVIIGSIEVNTVASAAKGIASRRGLGKIRHCVITGMVARSCVTW